MEAVLEKIGEMVKAKTCRLCLSEKPLSEFWEAPNKGGKKYLQIMLQRNVEFACACSICFRRFSSKKATHVDRDHKTGGIRGLLCVS